MQFTPITAEQRRQFTEEGYLIVRQAIGKDLVAKLLEAGDRMVATDQQLNRCPSHDKTTDGFRNVISMDDAFLPLLMNPTTVPLIVQLFGPRIQLATSHLIYRLPDPAGKKCKPGWHRDIMHTPDDLGHAHVPRMEVKCAYYLTDLSEPNSGSTVFAPGSHLLKEHLKIDPATGNPEKYLEPRLQPGDAVLFENRTFHAAGSNLSGRTRKAVMFGYSYRWLRPMDYLTQPPELVEKVDEIGKQLLCATADPLGRFIPGGGAEPLIRWCEQHKIHYSAA